MHRVIDHWQSSVLGSKFQDRATEREHINKIRRYVRHDLRALKKKHFLPFRPFAVICFRGVLGSSWEILDAWRFRHPLRRQLGLASLGFAWLCIPRVSLA